MAKSSGSQARARKAEAPRRRDAGRSRGAPIQEAVLSSALEDLAAHGMEGLSVERIAQAADVNKTSIYRRWATREALVAAALERVHDEISMHVADQGSLRADLVALGEAVASLAREPRGRALIRAAFSATGAPELVALAARKVETAALEAPALALVQRARARGEWRDDAAPDAVLAMLVGAILHRVMLEHAPPSKKWLTSVVNILVLGTAPR